MQVKRLVDILDDIAPTSSARDYHICTTTRKKFYQQYQEHLQKDELCLSKDFMVKKVLGRKHHSSGKIGNSWNSNKIHWVKDSSSCKHCDRHRLLLAKEELTTAEKMELEKMKLHVALNQA